ncbi:hypothetical protein [Fastidiosibacter lacustris]|uniref:hypothetical protein n=1 Tax=Fastidiosibacter lacustris TaxID=2056695 RepID=UPI001300AC76|nr:hypothetical protein [Fastidiosibacter lacustris]
MSQSSDLSFSSNCLVAKERLSNFYLWMISAGFFLYNYLIGNNYLPAGHVGLYSFSSLFYLCCMGYLYRYDLGKIRFDLLLFWVTIFIFSVFLLTIVYYLFDLPSSNYSLSLFTANLKFIIQYTSLLFAAYFVKVGRMRKVILYSFVLLSCLIFSNIDYNYLIFTYGYSADSNLIASYQGMASSYLMLLILLLVATRRKDVKLLFAFVGMVALFFIGARTQFVMGAMIFTLMLFKYHPKFTFILMFIGGISLCFYPEILLMHDSRIFNLFHLAHDTSFKARIQMFDAGIQDIINHPILGVYGGQVYYFDDLGSYIHNALSVWRQFGVFVFLVYVYVIMRSFSALFIYARKSSSVEIVLFYAIAIIVGLTFSQNYENATVAFIVGAALRCLSIKEKT